LKGGTKKKTARNSVTNKKKPAEGKALRLGGEEQADRKGQRRGEKHRPRTAHNMKKVSQRLGERGGRDVGNSPKFSISLRGKQKKKVLNFNCKGGGKEAPHP